MSDVRVTDFGLQHWSAQCADLARQLTDFSAPPLPSNGSVGQATVAVVAATNVALQGAGQVLSERVRTTSVKSSRAAASYVINDADSAQRIASVASPRGA